MVNVTMSGTYEGKPLEVLGKLIEERKRILGESAEDAVVATGIDALVSLRALTKVAKKMIPKSDVRFGREDPKYITGTKGKAAGRIFRRVVVGRWKDGAKKNKIRWQECQNVRRTKRGTVRVIRATSAERQAAWQRWGRISYRGLAKHALGLAMMRISTKNTALGDRVKARAARIAAANVAVAHSGAGARCFVLRIQDRLGYAVKALKGGPASVSLALQKAANKIAGRLCKVAEKKFGERIPSPFPEVKKRRVA